MNLTQLFPTSRGKRENAHSIVRFILSTPALILLAGTMLLTSCDSQTQLLGPEPAERSPRPNPMLAASSTSTELSVSNLSVASGSAYEVVDDGLAAGVTRFTDRRYTYEDPVPTELQGKTFIRTANDDKDEDAGSSKFLSFDVNQDVTVYVAHDDRADLPDWMSEFTDTGLDLTDSDPYSDSPASVYRKSFSAGTVTLGSNLDTNETAVSMYTVVVAAAASSDGSTALSITNLQVASGNSYKVKSDGFVPGAIRYVDRHYTISDPVPSAVYGEVFIQTANDDKNDSPRSSDFLSFDVNKDVVVYVAHDDRANVPSWMNDFSDSGLDVYDSGPYYDGAFSLYRKTFAAGTVTLGSNIETGRTKISMYSVIVEESSSESSDTEAPTTPTNLTAAAASSSSIDLTWDASSDNYGVAGYYVYRDGVRIATASNTYYTDSGLASSTIYSHTVSAYDAAGNTSGESASATATTLAASSNVTIPAESDWTYAGRVIDRGGAGSWDARIDGCFTPGTVVKKNGTIHLYYIGADGNRPDGGPANRSLGVATSSDGVNFSKYSGNPVITHQPTGDVEEGVFSAGAFVDGSGTVVTYFGGMEATSSTTVDSDGVLATSSDGLTFSTVGDVIDHSNSDVYRYGDEIFPVGAYRTSDGMWHSYYIGKGVDGMWDLGLASGSTKDKFSTYVGVLDLSVELKSGGDPIALSSDKIVVPIGARYSSTSTIEMRVTAPSSLTDLSTVAASYDFGDIKEFTMYLDVDLGKWFLYYITPSEDGIHLRTAPVSYE